MNARSLRVLALSASFAIVACGGGKSDDSAGSPAAPAPTGGSTAPAPSPAPGPAPAPTPSPPPAPSPAPAPAPPSAEAQRGALIYQRNCASCHGSDPDAGTQGIYKGVTPAVLQAAYGRVSEMNLFAAALSARDTQDIAAFISYRVGLP